MALDHEHLAESDAPLACVAAVEEVLGNETILAVGLPRPTVVEVLGDAALRAVTLTFAVHDVTAEVALVLRDGFAGTLEASAADELLVTACRPALEAAAHALAGSASAELADAREVEPDRLTDARDMVVFPMLDGTEPVGCYVARVGVVDVARVAAGAAPAAVAAPATTRTSVDAVHDEVAAPLVLADVEMGVTAELGRTRLTVRDLLAITPGTVLELDRAAGEPVEVLVNGTPIARGEVVVIDEEFAIRISEILHHADAS
jgi:flagellar motor switch protein FliN/FliY